MTTTRHYSATNGRLPIESIVLPIDKNIPIPNHGNTSPILATIRALEVGDSFFVQAPPGKPLPAHQMALAGKCRDATRAKNQIGKRFTVRQFKGGVRIWRIA